MRTTRFRIKTKQSDMMKKQGTLIALLLMSVMMLVGCEERASEAAPQPEAETPMQIATNDRFSSDTIHVGVIVSDLESSLQFYQDVIGMQRVSGFEVEGDLARRLGLTDGVTLNVEVLQLGAGETATQWKVMSFGDRAAPQQNTFIDNHTGMQYITLFVNDLNDSIARIEAHDVEMLGETPVQLPDGRHFVLVKDPDDTFVELIGPRGE